MKRTITLAAIIVVLSSILIHCGKEEVPDNGKYLYKAYVGGKLQRMVTTDAGNKITRIDFYNTSTGDATGYYLYEYDGNGRLWKVNNFDMASTLKTTTEYSYDAENRPSSYVYSTLQSGTIRKYLKTTLTYSNNNNKIRFYELDSLDRLRYYYDIERDENGNNTKLIYYGDDSLVRVVFAYSFDNGIQPLYYLWQNMGAGLTQGKGSPVGIVSDLTPVNGKVTFFLNDKTSMSYSMFSATHELNEAGMIKKETITYYDGSGSTETTYEYK